MLSRSFWAAFFYGFKQPACMACGFFYKKKQLLSGEIVHYLCDWLIKSSNGTVAAFDGPRT
ncbi:MAG: hypothetical protein B6I22_00170 [Desulfobacteraceae bacterium 4572_123]|nr:MAG: hypothetical protein B6I22_00170 [Desulfobacteraceae bacterium 4572_123]